eukprot:jgi/Tetstr1/459508/TSEL_004875.t1
MMKKIGYDVPGSRLDTTRCVVVKTAERRGGLLTLLKYFKELDPAIIVMAVTAIMEGAAEGGHLLVLQWAEFFQRQHPWGTGFRTWWLRLREPVTLMILSGCATNAMPP